MQTFKILKPCKAKIILFVILILCLTLIPAVKIERSVMGLTRVPVMAMAIGVMFNDIDTNTKASLLSSILYGLVFMFVLLVPYYIACLFVEGINLLTGKKRG